MPYTQEQIEAVHELPLRKEVRWLDLSALFPGIVAEATKRPMGETGEGKFATVDMGSAEAAAAVVAAHNEWLEARA